MSRAQLFAFTCVIFILASCHSAEPKTPPDARAPIDAGLEAAVSTDDCAVACHYWRALDCIEGQPSPGGVSCEDACRAAADAGVDTAKQLSCASTVKDCDALRACPY